MKKALVKRAFSKAGSPTRTRTRDQLINSQPLYQLSYRGIAHTVVARPKFWSRRAAKSRQPVAYASTRRMRSTDASSCSSEQANEIRT